MNLLHDDAFEDLLHLCSSGQISYGAASPSCCEYSRLKLRPGPGPKALRTLDHLGGIPGLSPDELQQVQESFIMLQRCITCLLLVFQSGGHTHLEQPANAMSWLESIAQQFLRQTNAFCVCVAACHVGLDIHKSWMFASSFEPITALASTCHHPQGSHESIQGTRDEFGHFKSRTTACYPAPLVQRMAALIASLLDNTPVDIPWTQCRTSPPLKAWDQPPFAQVDGGGLPSQPDWSQADRDVPDTFHDLRIQWVNHIILNRLDKKLIAHLALESKEPPFSEKDLQPFKTILKSFLTSHNLPVDWTIRGHQPIALNMLHTLQSMMRDRDTSLFPSLVEGVRAGFDTPIPRSGVFPLASPSEAETDPLSVHLTNWKSAEDDIQLTSELVQEEIDRGFVFEFEGTLEEAQQAYPTGISVGKLGIANADGRPPRLVVDSSVCGLNGRCQVPEKSTLPSAKEVLRAFP